MRERTTEGGEKEREREKERKREVGRGEGRDERGARERECNYYLTGIIKSDKKRNNNLYRCKHDDYFTTQEIGHFF